MGWAAKNKIGKRGLFKFTGKVREAESRPVQRARRFGEALEAMPRFEGSGRLIPRSTRREMARLRAKRG